jgi:hypothetical protein
MLIVRLKSLEPLVRILRKKTLPIDLMSDAQRQLIAEFEAVFTRLGREWPVLVVLGEQAGLGKVDLGMLLSASIDMRSKVYLQQGLHK